MTQSHLGTLDPDDTSGEELADLLVGWQGALHTNHSGETRPSYVQAGMTWLDISDTALWQMKLYTGSVDIPIWQILPAAGRYMLSGNRVQISGISPGLTLVESDFSSTPVHLYADGGGISVQTASGNNTVLSYPNGGMRADSKTTHGASFSTTANAYGVYGQSSANHGILGHTTDPDRAGVVGTNASGNTSGFLGYDSWGVWTGGPTYSGGGYQSSDERLKENIADAPMIDVLDKLQRLRVVSFDWRENTDAYNMGKRSALGVIAQEVQQVLPELVLPVTAPAPMEGIPGPDGEPSATPPPTLNQELGEFLSIDTGPLIYYLLAAVQALAKQVDPLTIRTSKYEMFKRMTDAEVETFDQIMAQQSRKKRHLFDQCSYLAHDDEFFAELKMAMTATWSAQRAAEILAED